MPDKTISQRGGAVRVRTKKLPDGKYLTIYVVRKKGKRGGKTVASKPKGGKKK